MIVTESSISRIPTPLNMSASLTQNKSFIVPQACPSCGRHLEKDGKSCSECGITSDTSAAKVKAAPPAVKAPVPNFAGLNKRVQKASAEAIAEYRELDFQIFRQRVFLIIHTAAFLLLNLTGVALAIKCYFGVCGDEGTKIALALIPMLYINMCALVFLSYIKSTRSEMQVLRQKLSHVHFRIEYGSLL